MNNFETIINTGVYQIVLNYLDIKDIKNIIYLNKGFFNNRLYIEYINKLIKKRASVSIIKFMIKNTKILKDVTINYYDNLLNNNLLTKKILVLFYFKFYPRQYINSIYNGQIKYKKYIVDKFKNKNTDTPTRYDLYNLLSKMSMDDILYIGW